MEYKAGGLNTLTTNALRSLLHTLRTITQAIIQLLGQK